MQKFKLRELASIWPLFAGIFIVVLLNLVWVASESRPPHWDMARHLWTSLQYLDLAQHQPLRLLDAYLYYPPLIYLLVLPFYMLFGISVVAAVAANNIFLIAGTLAVYAIGLRLGSRPTAQLGALLFATSPLIATQFKEFQIDGPLACITAISLWALIKSPDFSDTKSAGILGICLGAGLLTKWTFFGVVALPLLYALGLAIHNSIRKDGRTKKRLINLALMVIIIITIAGYWYVAHRHQLKIDLLTNGVSQAQLEGDPTGLSLDSLSYYPINMVNVQLYFIPVVLFLIGLWKALKSRSHAILILTACIIGTYIFFTAVSNKDARYTLPFIGPVAVLATYWMSAASKKAVALRATVAIYIALTYWAISFGFTVMPKEISLASGAGRIILWAQHGYIIAAPTSEDWKLEGAIKRARNSSLVYSGPDTIWFNSWAVSYYAAKYHVDLGQPARSAQYTLTRSNENSVVDSHGTLIHDKLPDQTWITLSENKEL